MNQEVVDEKLLIIGKIYDLNYVLQSRPTYKYKLLDNNNKEIKIFKYNYNVGIITDLQTISNQYFVN